MTHLAGHQHLPEAHSPWGVLRWALVGTKGARSPTHVDIAATVIEQLVGLKSVSIAVPRADKFDENGHEGDWLSRHAVENWAESQNTARDEVFRWETFLLRPGMSLYVSSFPSLFLSLTATTDSWMPHGTRHFIMTLEDSLAQGVHTINSAQAAVAVGVLITLTVCDGDATNEPTEPMRWLFVRLFIFWAEKIVGGKRATPPLPLRLLMSMLGASVDLNHFPDVLTREGLMDVLYLASYVILYPSLRPENYPDEQDIDEDMGTALPMPFDRYAEYEYALWMVVQLAAYLDSDKFQLKPFHFEGEQQHDYDRVVQAESVRELLDVSSSWGVVRRLTQRNVRNAF